MTRLAVLPGMGAMMALAAAASLSMIGGARNYPLRPAPALPEPASAPAILSRQQRRQAERRAARTA